MNNPEGVFKNRKAFLTGASRGIGKCICELLKKEGADVFAPARDELDLSDRESIGRYVKSNSNLDIDIFIHCAAINELSGIDEIDSDLIDRVFQVNYCAPLELLKMCVSGMKEKRHGRIVFISSLYAIISKERRIAYSSSKNALTGLTKTLALELAPYQIMVNAVAPGYVLTDMTKKNLSIEEITKIKSDIPTGQFQTEQDVAELTAFLCSGRNNSITGQLIAIDGGYTCK